MHLLANMTDRSRAMLPLLVLTAGIDHDQESVNRPNGSPWHHIYYVEKGQGILHTPEGQYILKEGHVYFFRGNMPVHYYRTTKVFKSAWVTFVGKGVEDILEYYGAKNFAYVKSESIYPMMVNIFKLVERKQQPDVLSRYLYELIIVMFNKINNANTPPSLIKAQQYIDQNYDHDISVLDIALHVGVSESLIYRLFKEHDSQTPMEYLKQVRIHEAQKLLITDKKIQISKVSDACGFANAAYFCKVFKNEIGTSPKKYQKNYGM